MTAGVSGWTSADPRGIIADQVSDPTCRPPTNRLALCLAVLALITVVNLRGVRESGLAFVVPTYLFIASLLAVLAIGVVKVALAGGRPSPVVAPPRRPRRRRACGS